MAAKLTRNGDVLSLTLAGMDKASFNDALARAKMIPGRRWNPDEKTWEFPADAAIAERIMHTIRPVPSPDVIGWVRKARADSAEQLATDLPDDALGPLSFPWASKLYGYQRAGVEFLVNNPASLLADDMGLGKTVQAISAVWEYVERHEDKERLATQPRLVIAPNSVKGNWAKEIEQWAGEQAYVLDAKTAEKRRAQLKKFTAEPGAWIVVNWEKIRAKRVAGKVVMAEPILGEVDWTAIIADEAHRAKNRKSQQTLGLWQLKAPVRLALTGTPILNSPDEVWSLLAWIASEQYGRGGGRTAYWTFYDQYVDYYEGPFGRVITGARNPDALRFELANKLVRRTKGSALDLPEKTRQFMDITLHPKQRKLYEDAEKEMWIEIVQAEGPQALEKNILEIPNGAARCTRLRQIASSPALLGGEDVSAKLDVAVELIEDSGRQVVVFSEFKKTCSLLAERLAKRKISSALITGDIPPEVRTDSVQEFQEGDIDVMICTLDAGGVGITLTAADTVIFLERDWTPAINEQAEDRLHRIGQDRNVTVIILQGVDTIDTDRVAPANELKSAIVGSVIQQDTVRETQ
ncbi:HepA Superfamily II DNA/RNA helicases, SNF2 family [uncultured Caudovirales phage]|uniref:HepA Superfamily II DNA/RNA helicases, SNF2 family n=1 Tax=uncultured Caudovirales phage TaxID=2100421 RepID=A0A6J5QI97_9CAUD|nr:HepA Superfamily II DNA/RNA helicases, SNF2 family [uncultured Caudovirales phage]CAB4199090.1 HepA Superfamily II DNA/RNA helicases, SNF2 family [uncultured Caudovirales phage]CAB5228422.1 HepA Superfamily II DNA/RNA helicases, SNF2 family [uncultured Caudovirales phage]